MYFLRKFKKRKTHYSSLTVNEHVPLVRKHLYYLEFTEAISIILKTRYEMLHIHWGISGNTRKTRLRLKALKLKERKAVRALQFRPVTKLGKRHYKAISNPNRHVLVVLNSQKAYYHKKNNCIVVEY